MAGKLTAQYVQDHMVNVHTTDSWARAITEQIMHQAVKQLGEGCATDVTVDATFKITTFDPKLCVRVCTNIGGVEICTHIG